MEKTLIKILGEDFIVCSPFVAAKKVFTFLRHKSKSSFNTFRRDSFLSYKCTVCITSQGEINHSAASAPFRKIIFDFSVSFILNSLILSHYLFSFFSFLLSCCFMRENFKAWIAQTIFVRNSFKVSDGQESERNRRFNSCKFLNNNQPWRCFSASFSWKPKLISLQHNFKLILSIIYEKLVQELCEVMRIVRKWPNWQPQ